MNLLKKCFLCAALSLLCSVGAYAKEITAISPDTNLRFDLNLDSKSGRMVYSVTYRDKQVILPSQLGISGFNDNIESIEVTDVKNVDTSWRPIYGERSVINDNYTENLISVKAKGQPNNLNLIVRAYNEGIAFRYCYTGNGFVCIKDEFTTFGVPENTECWFAPYAQAVHTKMAVENWPGEAERPLTLKLDNGLFAALCEAEMVDYCRTKFVVRKGEKNLIRCKMYDTVEEFAPFMSPWRLIMVANNECELLANNDIMLNLNEPCAIEDTSWIKPGKIIRVTKLNNEESNRVVDFAAERGIDYIHFDAGWYGPEARKTSDPRKSIAGLDMPEVVKYANSKGIGVWLYVNQRALTEYLEDILPIYKAWGIKGIKFGFVHVGSDKWTSWVHNAVRRCAEYGLMVDIHDEYRPTGFSRTYPNLLTQEGVRGNEEFPDGVVNTTQPFTRFLAGAADCTVCYFHRPELKPELAHLPHKLLKNTPAHQIALSVINYSPLQFLYWYDSPASAQNEPELNFFNEVSTVWDDTRIVSGKIGEYVVMARKKDGVWFVGAITNNDARTININMDFLESGKKYVSTIYTDGGDKVKTRTHVAINDKSVTSKDNLKFDVKSRGGIAMIIKEK